MEELSENKKLTYGQMRRKAQENYIKIYVPSITQLEKIRVRKYQRARNFLILLSITAVYTFFMLLIKHEEIYTAGIIGLIAIVQYYQTKNNYEKENKSKLLKVVSRCMEAKYIAKEYNSMDALRESGVVDFFNKEDYQDTIISKYHNSQIELIKTHLKRKEGMLQYNVFKGVIVRIKLPIKFNSHTLMHSKTLKIEPTSNLNPFNINNNTLKNKYNIYTTNPKEAKFLFAQDFLPKIHDFEKVFATDKISFAFYRNEIIAAVQTNENPFDMFAFENTLENTEQYFGLFDVIMSLYKIVDYYTNTENS